MNKVNFQSEGETLVGNLFLPTSNIQDENLPAVVVGGSWITVKEQMANLYAERLAEQGFAALAFDFRGYGESSGEPRQYESAKNKTQDFKNALTFLQSQPMVDPDRIGGLAICASAGYMARAVAGDGRFKSFVTIAGWFQHPDTTPESYGGAEGVRRRVDLANAAMNKFRSSGQMDYVPAYDPNNENAAMFFEVDYYADPKRGAIPQWENQFAVASWSEWLQLNGIDGVAEKITVPVLFIHSDNSALPDNVRRFHRLVKGSKDLYWSSEGTQTDYYDQEPYVGKAAQIAAVHFRNTLA
ncbi:MAG: alpha/beta hydrolase [Acidobacteria bacterium]|nr:alpha/beta hydrolase [Acidobacteriota bacterium]